jgi:ATP-binding cassette, subfamily F, member 3
MLVASLQNVAHSYGVHEVLTNVSLTISTGQRLGLIGANGSGKTTMLRILTGEELPSGGMVVVPKGVRVGYVPQHVSYRDDDSVWDCIAVEHKRLSETLRMQEERLSVATPENMDQILRAYQAARDDYDKVDGDRFPHRAETMLDALGLQGKMRQPVGSLSGGEKNVVSMTRALLKDPDFLILDEPANHLDYEGVAWLEDFINRFKGAVMIVSHNRYLLDRVVNGIVDLSAGLVKYYEGGYSSYRATRLRDLLAQQSDYIANQKRLSRLEQLVKRFEQIARATADPAWGKRLRARRTQLEREKGNAVDEPILGPDKIDAAFTTEASQAKIALQLRGYSRSFGPRILLEDATLDIACGERVGLVGVNGSGKTTLLREIVANGAWDHDVIRVGPSQTIGYSAQEQEILHNDRTIMEEIRATATVSAKGAFALLSRFLFARNDVDKRIGELSGGERNRLQLARLMLLKPNFLILDEPTNHLDIPASEAIEEALDNYEGTLLVVSHDRYFLDKVIDRVVEVRDHSLHSYAGNFTEFWHARKEERAKVVGRITKRGQHRTRQKQSRLPEDAAALERRIEATEQEKAALETSLEDAFNGRDRRAGHRVQKELDRVNTLIDELYQKWMSVTAPQ